MNPDPPSSPGFNLWRRLHLIATGLLCLSAVVHAGLTARLCPTWSPDAVWFLGTGLGLLLLGLLNWSHLGHEPCQQPTTRLVRLANWAFVVFGIGAVLAVPEPHAFVIVAVLVAQAVAAHWTLPGPN